MDRRRGFDLQSDIFIFGTGVGLLRDRGIRDQAGGTDQERYVSGTAGNIVRYRDVGESVAGKISGNDGIRIGARWRFEGLREEAVADIDPDGDGTRAGVRHGYAAEGLLHEIGNCDAR